MIRIWRVLVVGGVVAFGAAGWTANAAAPADKPAADKKAPAQSSPEKPAQDKADASVKPDAAKAKPKPELSDAMVALRNQVRQMLAYQHKQPFNTRDNLPVEIMAFCGAYGCDTQVAVGGPGGQELNGITCLCWNYPCAGYELLKVAEGHIVARIGYGCEQYPGEFMAMLALSRVPATYPIRVGSDTRTVADLVEAEKLSCRTAGNMSLKLLGLAFYEEAPKWKNDQGEDWSLERIVQQEIAQPVISAPDGGLNRLLGLSYAVQQRVKHHQPIEGQFERAQKYVAEFQKFALELQNADGSWGPRLLAARSTTSDTATQLWATGRVLEWLALSLPDKQLEDPRVVLAVEQVLRLLSTQRFQRNVPYLSTREIDAFGHAVHALAIYDDRVFKPFDAPAEESKPAAEEKAEK